MLIYWKALTHSFVNLVGVRSCLSCMRIFCDILFSWFSTLQPGYSLRTFTGHSASVMSLDFHPNKEDLICSCDGDGEIRYWSINNGSCARVFKVCE